MTVYNFKELRKHVGHKIVCVEYGGIDSEYKSENLDNQRIIDVWNVAIECKTCNEVLLSFDMGNEDEDEEDPDET